MDGREVVGAQIPELSHPAQGAREECDFDGPERVFGSWEATNDPATLSEHPRPNVP